MWSRVLIGAVVGLLAAVVLASAGDARPIARTNSPSRLMVTGREFSLTLSRSRVARGEAIVQFVNRGQDPHDLRIQRVGGSRQIPFPKVGAGKLVQLETRLSRGRYRLWCSLPGHDANGMHAALSVRR